MQMGSLIYWWGSLENMYSKNANPYLYAAASLLIAGFFIYKAITFEKKFPKYDDLLFAKGELAAESSLSRHTAYFSLSNSDTKFVFHSSSGPVVKVRDLTKTGLVATIGYDQNDSGRKSVYYLEIDGNVVSSYEDIKAANKSDNKWIFLLVPWFIFSAICFIITARRRKNV